MENSTEIQDHFGLGSLGLTFKLIIPLIKGTYKIPHSSSNRSSTF